jgi:hypothetical protein
MLLAVGAFWFWVTFACLMVLMIAAVEYDKPGLATLSIIVFFVLLGWLGNINILNAIRERPLLSLGCLAGYFAAGTMWSICKWWFYVRKLRDKFDEYKRDFLARNNRADAKTIPDDLRILWLNEVDYNYSLAPSKSKPIVAHNKSRIMTWMVYWPWSLVWTMVNDPIKRLFKEIYRVIQGFMQKISDRAFADVEHELYPTEEEKQRRKENERKQALLANR